MHYHTLEYKGFISSQGWGRNDKSNEPTDFYELSRTTDTSVISDLKQDRRLNSLTLTLNYCHTKEADLLAQSSEAQGLLA